MRISVIWGGVSGYEAKEPTTVVPKELNPKVTVPADVAYIEVLLSAR